MFSRTALPGFHQDSDLVAAIRSRTARTRHVCVRAPEPFLVWTGWALLLASCQHGASRGHPRRSTRLRPRFVTRVATQLRVVVHIRPCLHTRLSVSRALSAAPASWKARHMMAASNGCGTSSSEATFAMQTAAVRCNLDAQHHAALLCSKKRIEGVEGSGGAGRAQAEAHASARRQAGEQKIHACSAVPTRVSTLALSVSCPRELSQEPKLVANVSSSAGKRCGI